MSYFRQAFYRGISLWAGWLPLLATTIFVFILGLNINRDQTLNPALSLEGFVGTTEMFIFFIITPLFFTRISNLVAGALTFYCVERLLLSGISGNASLAVLLLLTSTTIIAVLGDKMPFLMRERPNDLAHRMREIMVIVLSFAAIGMIISALINASVFHSWLAKSFGMPMSANTMIIILGLVFFAWISVALGVTRHFTLPLICLPSLVILAYVTKWPNYILLVPFALCLTLSLAVVDQRLVTVIRKA